MTYGRPRAVGPGYAPAKAISAGSFDPMAAAIIARCTRDGNVSWQSVATMLGRCVHSVRSDYDPSYLKPQDSENTA